jgi:hypothetical protein
MSVDLLLRSFKTLGDIEERRLCPPFDLMDRNELAVVRWLLWRFNDQGGKCNPSDADIAAGTGLSDRVIRRSRNALRERGLIDWQEGRSSGRRGSNSYDLTAIWAACRDLTADMAELPANKATTTGQNAQSQPAVLAEEKKGNYEGKGEKENELKPVADAPGADPDFQEEDEERSGSGLSVSSMGGPRSTAAQAAVERREDEEELAKLEAQLERSRKPELTAQAIADVRARLNVTDGHIESGDEVAA